MLCCDFTSSAKAYKCLAVCSPCEPAQYVPTTCICGAHKPAAGHAELPDVLAKYTPTVLTDCHT